MAHELKRKETRNLKSMVAVVIDTAAMLDLFGCITTIASSSTFQRFGLHPACDHQ
jgi:hypothetical protein